MVREVWEGLLKGVPRGISDPRRAVLNPEAMHPGQAELQKKRLK